MSYSFFEEDAILDNYTGDEQDIIIPKCIKRINKRALYRKKLYSVIIPDSVISINFKAFANNFLKEIVLPKN